MYLAVPSIVTGAYLDIYRQTLHMLGGTFTGIERNDDMMLYRYIFAANRHIDRLAATDNEDSTMNVRPFETFRLRFLVAISSQYQ